MADLIPARSRPVELRPAGRALPRQDLTAVTPSPLCAVQVSPDGVVLRLALPAPQACRLTVIEGSGAVMTCDLMPGEAMESFHPCDDGAYDLTVIGPQGFVRAFRGDTAGTLAGLDATLALGGAGRTQRPSLMLHNGDGVTREFCVDGVAGTRSSHRLPPRGAYPVLLPADTVRVPYDITVTAAGFSSFLRRFAGPRC